MDKKKRYLNYIVQQYHTDPNIQLLYRDLTTGEIIENTEIKCGITVIDSTSEEVGRFTELGRTKAPIGCIPVYVYEASSRSRQMASENAFKILCDALRCKSNGLTEYYNLDVSTAKKFYESQGLTDVSSEFIDERTDDAGAKKVRRDTKTCDEMEAKWSSTGLFTNFGSSYVSYNNVDSIPGLNNVSYHPLGKTTFINFYHAGKLSENEEFNTMMIDLGKEKGLSPVINKSAVRFNFNTKEEGLEMFRTLKLQDFIPMNS